MRDYAPPVNSSEFLVPVYVTTKKDIIFMSAGKSEDMNDTNHGHNLVN